jgi:hypothetical protein
MTKKNTRRLTVFSLLFFVVVGSRIRDGKSQYPEKAFRIRNTAFMIYPPMFCSIQNKSCEEYDSRRCSSCPGEDTRRNNRQTSAASAIPPQYSGCIPYPVQISTKHVKLKYMSLSPYVQRNRKIQEKHRETKV